VQDFIFNGKKADLTASTYVEKFKKDSSADSGPTENWKYARAKSTEPPTSQCTDSGRGDTFAYDFIDCANIDIHAYRNFDTGANSANDDIVIASGKTY
jgi:hypothetical protein